jgi:hypothetical protein
MLHGPYRVSQRYTGGSSIQVTQYQTLSFSRCVLVSCSRERGESDGTTVNSLNIVTRVALPIPSHCVGFYHESSHLVYYSEVASSPLGII